MGLSLSKKTNVLFLAKIAPYARDAREFMTLRVAQFSLKIAHLSFSMVLRGPRACGLRPRLRLLLE